MPIANLPLQGNLQLVRELMGKNEIQIQDLGFGNHPGLLKSGSDLYVVGTAGFFKSTDKGLSYAKLSSFPFWLGGVIGIPYKKSMTIGEGG